MIINNGKRNCEHFANMIIYGINYSKQAEKHSGNASFASHIFTGDAEVTTGGSIKLTNEINSTNNKFEEKDNWRAKELTRKYLQEVPPKDNNCRIM